MSYEKLYYRTRSWEEFAKKAQKEHPNILRKSINSQFNKFKKQVGPQEKLRKKYVRKYEYEFSYTKNRDEFVKECRRRYRKSTKANLVKRYYDIRKRFEKEKDEVIKVMDLPVPEAKLIKRVPVDEIDFTELIPINEIQEPAEMKKMQIEDMKRYGYKLTDGFLKQYGYNRFEINWLKHNKII